jgi:hypothetical protein
MADWCASRGQQLNAANMDAMVCVASQLAENHQPTVGTKAVQPVTVMRDLGVYGP